MLNNHLVGAICTFGCLIGGAIGALISVLMTRSTDLSGDFPLWLSATLGFFIGFCMTMPSMEIVESVVTAVFVCYAKNQDVLMLANPDLYEEISEAYAIMTGESLGREDEDEDEEEEEEDEGEWDEDEDDWDEDEGHDGDSYDDYDSDGEPKKTKQGKQP